MANCMVTPLMLAREALLWLPSDAETFAEESTSGDVLVGFITCNYSGSFLVAKLDRILSLDDIREKYKPALTEALHDIWSGKNSPFAMKGNVVRVKLGAAHG